MYGDYLGEFVCGYWDLKSRGLSSFGLIFQKGAWYLVFGIWYLVFGGQSNYGLCLSFIFCKISVTCIFLLHVGKILFLLEVHSC